MPRAVVALTLAAGVVLATWVSAPAAPTAAPADVPDEILAAIDDVAPLAAEVEQETAQLRARLATSVAPPDAGRDPFNFGAPRVPVRASEPMAPPVTSANTPPAAPAEPTIVWPSLSAIMTGTATTAVVAWGDTIEFVEAGQTFKDFVIVSVGTASIELRHAPSSTTKTLVLR